MGKKFYIGEGVSQRKVNVELSPRLAETLDETLDNMTVSLEVNEDSYPYAPFQKFKIYDDNTLIKDFIISADSVEVASTNPLRYKHTLTLIQTSEFLTKHEIRNTVFSTSLLQYSEVIKDNVGGISEMIEPFVITGTSIGSTPEMTSGVHGGFQLPIEKKITIDLSKIKISKIKINFSFDVLNSYYVYNSWGQATPHPFEIRKISFSQIYALENKPTKWSEIYYSVSSQGDVFNPPSILFKIVSNGETETKRIDLLDSKINNGDDIKIPDEILSWIKNYSTGILTIEAEKTDEVQQYDSFILSSKFKNKKFKDFNNNLPVRVELNYNFEIKKHEFSVYDVIDTLLKQQQKNTLMYHDSPKLFNLPTETEGNNELYHLLKDTEAPNFVFTQSNMYDALVEIFKLFDAIFKIDENGYLDIEYYNDHNPVSLTNSNKSGRTSSITEDRYANKLISYYQNTKIDDRFPNSNSETATAYVRSKSLGVPAADGEFVFMVPKPIDIIKKVFLKWKNKKSNFRYEGYIDLERREYYDSFFEQNVNYFSYDLGISNFSEDILLDITDNVVESSLWMLLKNDKENIDYRDKYKINCLEYTRGTNYINVYNFFRDDLNFTKETLKNVIISSLMRKYNINEITSLEKFYKIPDIIDVGDIQMSVEYIALNDGKLVTESIDNKYDGEIFANQGNGSIDINKLGLNMVGLSLKLGKPTLTMTQKFTNWNDRIKKGQYFTEVDEKGIIHKWVANLCNYTLVTNDVVEATIEFVEDFNGLASRIQLNREKRLSNISNELTTKCEETYGEYIYYTSDEIESSSIVGEKIAFNKTFLQNQLLMSFGSTIGITGDTTYNFDSRVVTTDIEGLNEIQGSALEIYSLDGVNVETIETTNNDYGTMTISDPDDETLKLEIPYSSAYQGCVLLELLSNKVLYQPLDGFFENPLTSQIVSRTSSTTFQVDLYIIKYDGIIRGAAIDSVYVNRHKIEGPGFDIEEVVSYEDYSKPYTVEYALVTALNSDNSMIYFQNSPVKDTAVPLVVYGSGNSVCFEMSFEDPISAGNQLLKDYKSNLWIGWLTGWFSRMVPYTDEEGRADKFTINFVKMQDDLTRCFPKMTKAWNDETSLSTYSFGKLEQFAYYKKPNEIFALNYQIHFMPINKNNDFLSNEFIKNNGFKNGLNLNKLHIVYSTDASKKYTILDTKGYDDNVVSIVDIDSTIGTSGEALSSSIKFDTDFDSSEDWPLIESWAIVDEDNNIYFASNNSVSNHSLGDFYIYFKSRHHRL